MHVLKMPAFPGHWQLCSRCLFVSQHRQLGMEAAVKQSSGHQSLSQTQVILSRILLHNVRLAAVRGSAVEV